MIEIRLPFPPSTNNLFLNAPRGRVITPEYRAWKDHAGWELKAQRPPAVTDRCTIEIHIDERRQGDADNRAKAVLDLLVEGGVLRGDSKKYVKGTYCGWEAVEGCRVRIKPVE